ncbi:MAG: Gfo/Idh/MocA family oxidoreductase [Verrucomicrobia bacterium]|nr:Gfo/Idh/MocA family oxidoreductase [Verrucomicrobiota bacterium]
MNSIEHRGLYRPTRREFLKTSTKAMAGVALATAVARPGYTAENNTIKVALIGSGGRGPGAAGDALSTKSGPIKLVAMADVFENRLKDSYAQVKKDFPDQVDVPEDRRFVGFDAYKKAMDCLSPGDVAIFATPPGFRWLCFEYAIEKGLHVFMEKPTTVDGPSTRRMIKLAGEAKQKNLKVGVGLMCRHCKARQELADRIQQGQIGDLLMMRAYRMHGPIGFFASPPKPANKTDLMYQIERFHSFLWASGGAFSDFYIHNIDECSWMKGSWPVKAQAVGGRHYRGDSIDQNFDSYSVEYTFGDGARLFLEGRCITGAEADHSSWAHGTKGLAVVSEKGHIPSRARIYKGQNLAPENLLWAYPQPEPQPYQVEWDDLIAAIRSDQPYNEVKRGVEASLVTSMGRMAAHTGRTITYDEILNCDHEFAPGLDQLTKDSPAPLQPDANGRYPVPQPGLNPRREY